MPHGGWYGYVGSLTRPVTHHSETEGAVMPHVACTDTVVPRPAR